jgi:HPt (histidine-containing phosphotransfer) domain-containing protein
VASTGVSQQKSTPITADVIDRLKALSRVDGDGELMASLVDIFFTQATVMMETIRAAVASGDPGKLEEAAHRLKGSVSIFCAEDTTEAALTLEKIGRDGDIKNAAKALALLEQQMAKLQPALKQFRDELQPSS